MATLTAREAASRMGVKVETLYAYVSRGLLESQPGADGRSSIFDERAVESLARRGRPRQSSRSSSLNLLIETRLTALSPQGVRYRGLPVSDLAKKYTFEDVADLLWLGELPHHSGTRDIKTGHGKTGHDKTRHDKTWRGAILDGVDDMPIRDALRVVTARVLAASPTDPSLAPADVAAAGRHLIATMVDSLPPLGDGRAPRLVLPAGGAPIRSTIAGRLWTRISPRRPAPGMLAVLNAALVLMADHELAASTLGVRVAASTHASPCAVVLAGLGVLSGPYHGGASRVARGLIDEASNVGAARAVTATIRAGQRIPGFGHSVYTDIDPRAAVLLDLLRRGNETNRTMAIVDDIRGEVSERIGKEPNVDFALAAMTALGGMPDDAGEAVMSIARTAGWLAHAIEEYDERPLRFRPRASYVGR